MSKHKIEWEKEYDLMDMDALKTSRKRRVTIVIEVLIFFFIIACFLITKAVHAVSIEQYVKYMAVGVAMYICFAALLHAILYKAGKMLEQYGKRKGKCDNGKL